MALGEFAGSLAGASAATAGLTLVFLGNTATSFDGYQTEQQGAVRARYKQRAGEIFFGFLLSLVSCCLSLAAQFFDSGVAAAFAAGALGIGFLFVVHAGWLTVMDIN